MADWDEAEHPRDGAGRFRDKAGGGWVGVVSDRIRGGSRYKRVEGRDLSDEIVADPGRYVDLYLDPNRFGDEVVDDLARRQGFDGLPTVGTAAELDEAVAEGGVEMWRGVRGSLPSRSVWDGNVVFHQGSSPIAYHEQWRSGEYRSGNGIYGQGTYTSVDRRVAEHWGVTMTDDRGQLIYVPDDSFLGTGTVTDPRSYARMVLSPDARVIDFSDPALGAYTKKLREGIEPAALVEAVQRQEAELAGFDRPADAADLYEPQEWEQFARSTKKKLMALLADRGRAAIALGYDAMVVRSGEKWGDGSDYDATQYVILNRTALLVQEAYDENLLPPEVVRSWETHRAAPIAREQPRYDD